MALKDTPNKRILSLDQRQYYAKVFVDLDTNGDGWMSRGECRDWIMKTGFPLTHRQLRALFRWIDINNDGKITLDEFLGSQRFSIFPHRVDMHAHIGVSDLRNKETEEQFKSMDVNGDGYLSHEELRTGLLNCGYDMTVSQVEKFAEHIDKNGDGKISYREFLAAFE